VQGCAFGRHVLRRPDLEARQLTSRGAHPRQCAQ
jgi:hypothetical protein